MFLPLKGLKSVAKMIIIKYRGLVGELSALIQSKMKEWFVFEVLTLITLLEEGSLGRPRYCVEVLLRQVRYSMYMMPV